MQTAQTVSLLRVIAGVLAMALLLWGSNFPASLRSAAAASITNASDTLSDSDLGVASNHTFQFTLPNGAMTGSQITLTFPGSSFTFPTNGFDYLDFDVLDDSVPITLGSTATGDVWGVATTSNTITFSLSTSTGQIAVASSSVILIRIGTNATGPTGDSQITNPVSANSYEIEVGGTIQDSGSVMVAILDDVVVTANIATNFSFSVSAVNAGQSVNGTTTNGTSTATTIPFGTSTAGFIKTIAQDLTVTTNAAAGFAVTVYTDGPFDSSTNADIDGFIDGAYTDTPSAWQAPSANPSDEKTWGHWGMTSGDPDLFGSNLWKSPSTTPRTMFSHNSVVNASTTRVGYQLQISSLQEAGDDYETTLTYIATPVF